MVVGRVSSLFCATFAVALAFACSSDPAPKEGVGGAAGTSANGGTSAGTTSGGAGAAAAAGGTTGGSASGAATGGAGGAAAGTHNAGSANGGGAQGGSSTAGQGGGGSAGTSELPWYLGPGVACELNQQNDADNRCGEGQACCYIQFGATHCGANAAACDPCPDKEECTTIACDEPADCPGGVCCATLGDGNGAVELSRLECQTSCDEYQYVICATVADCPKEFTECGISSSGIRRCFH